MKHSKRWLGTTAAVLAFSLVAAACSSGNSTSATTTTTAATSTTAATTTTGAGSTTAAPSTTAATTTTGADGITPAGPTTTAVPPSDGVYQLGGGAVLDTNKCPSNWDSTQGLTDTEINIGTSMPLSGPAAGFGTISNGMQIYFDNVPPIAGRKVKIIGRDDGYNAGRTVTNVNEMIDGGNIFAFSTIIGSPNNMAVRDTLNTQCIPQLLSGSGLPEWGDPGHYPFTSGAILPYSSEALIWCSYLAKTLGKGATVAALYVNSDFGKSYQKTFEQCAPKAGLNIVATELHDPNADTVQNEVTTLAATKAQAFVVGSTGANCPRAVAGARKVGWDTLIMVSATCQNIGLFWTPLGAAANGIMEITTTKDVSDPRWADDPWMNRVRKEIKAAGIDPESAAYATGFIFAQMLEAILRQAAATPEGLNRATVAQAVWQLNYVFSADLPGATIKTDGANDAYLIEAGEMSKLVYDPTTKTATWSAVSPLINEEGQLGHYTG